MDLNIDKQIELFNIFKEFYKELPFSDLKKDGLRYYFDNPWFGYSDSISLYSMLRYSKPKRIIEIGSGYSSAVILDTNEYFLKNNIQITLIEPNPERLKSLLKKEDITGSTIISNRLQNVDLNIFKSLEKNDILFIDSSHIYTNGSDVELIFTKILPMLNKNVYIHFHDIIYPFIYPTDWANRGYNEAMYVKELLNKNNSFKIIFFNSYICEFYKKEFELEMPLYLKNPGGSIWIEKI